MAALETIAAANTSGLALTELAECCQLPAATTYRILQGLLDANLIMVRPGRNKEYVVGPRLFRLLHAGIGDSWLHIAAQPVLDGLVQELNETCFVTQLVGKKVISIAWAVPESGLRNKVYPGDVMPPHAAASAKAILAYQADALVPHILAVRERFTRQTKTELARIKEEYVRVRRDGFAMCWGEMDEGLGAIACPVEVEGLGVQYAVAVTGLTKRLERRPIKETVALPETGSSSADGTALNAGPATSAFRSDGSSSRTTERRWLRILRISGRGVGWPRRGNIESP